MSAGAFRRVRAMIVKEFWALLRDPRGRVTLIAPPLLELVLFGYAATLEVKNFTLGIYDRDRGVYSRELIERFAGSPNIRDLLPLESPAEVRAAIDQRRVIAVVAFNSGFSRDVAANRPASIQATYDGRRSNAAQIVDGYLRTIIAGFSAELKPDSRPAGGATIVSNWFNPNLTYLWFAMPSLIVTIAALSVLSVTTQSIARERELGTYDQLMVTPLRTWEILTGKIVPAIAIGLFNATLYLVLIPLVFGVPFLGSVLLFYIALFLYLAALIGLGLFISTIARTQQQAFLGMFLSAIPLILLSGYTSPVDNMPPWLQVVAAIDPLKYFITIVDGLFLKGMPAVDVFSNLWPLLIITTVTLAGAAIFFRSRAE